MEIFVFDHVIKPEGAKRAGQQGLFVLGSSAVQVGLIAGLVWVASSIKTRVAAETTVPVKFVRPVAPALLAVPPAPRPLKPVAPRRRPADAPKPPPTALIQPRELPRANVDPALDEPPEEEVSAPSESDAVVGGAVGAVSTQAAQPKPPQTVSEPANDVPTYAGAGFTRPRQAERNCVQTSLRIPRGLEGFASNVTVKFAIGKDGTPSMFQIAPPEPDARLTSAIWQAVQTCRWLAGTNPHGQPTKIWVVMPFRFQAD